MYIIGDIGNSETKIFLFDKKLKLIKKKILKTNLINNKYLNKNLSFTKKYKFKIVKILFSSVVPQSFISLKKFFKNKLKKNSFELKQINLNKKIDIRVPFKQVGSDRIANAISLINNYQNFIIIDFGTATTFDVVVKNKYLGGVIAPGVSISLIGLTKKASLIPKIKLTRTSKVIGNDTDSAVKSGFYWGYLGLIDNIIKLIIKECDRSFKIVLTGGLSHLFKNKIKQNCKIEKDLTIKGLLRIVKN